MREQGRKRQKKNDHGERGETVGEMQKVTRDGNVQIRGAVVNLVRISVV